MHKDYSQTPLPDKLGIKQGARVALQRAPEGFAELERRAYDDTEFVFLRRVTTSS